MQFRRGDVLHLAVGQVNAVMPEVPLTDRHIKIFLRRLPSLGRPSSMRGDVWVMPPTVVDHLSHGRADGERVHWQGASPPFPMTVTTSLDWMPQSLFGNIADNATIVPHWSTIVPTSSGNFPRWVLPRPRMAEIIIFSAPCGYFTSSSDGTLNI